MSEAPPGPGHAAARAARDSIEEALLALPEIPLVFDRADLRDRLLRAVEHAYVALDNPVLAVAHLDALTQAAARADECRALLARLADPSSIVPLGRAVQLLEAAAAGLQRAASEVAQIQLERRADLTGGRSEAPPERRPFRASIGVPQLHAPPRAPLLPHVDVDPIVPLPEPARPPVTLPRPLDFAALQALAADTASGAIAERLAPPEPQRPEPQHEPPLLELVYEPAIEEVEVLRLLAHDCLEDIAIHRTLRKPNAMEGWLDQAPFEQRLLENLDAFAALAGAGLPLVSLFLAEAKAPDPERAFAAALVLGTIEGSDTLGAAILMLKQSAPETHPGWVEGLWLAPSPAIDAAMVDLCTSRRPDLVALALDVLHARDSADAADIAALLDRPEPEIRVRVARALATALSREEAIERLEEMLTASGDAAQTLAAAESLLRRGHHRAAEALRALVVGGTAPRSPLQEGALRLLCLAGRSTDLDLLTAAINAQPTPALLRGLGRFGHVESLSVLLMYLHHSDEEVVRAAAEALERITGAGLREVVEEPWEIELPPEVAQAAGAIPIPKREVDRVSVDPARWSAWLTQNIRRFDSRYKYRAGILFTPLQIVAELEAPVTPPEAREEATLELALVTGLRFRFSPGDWVARQQQALAELRRRVGSLRVAPGAWSLGLTRESEPPAARGSSRPPGAAPTPPLINPLPFRPGFPGPTEPRAPSAALGTDETFDASSSKVDEDTITTAIRPPPLNPAQVEVDVFGIEAQAEQAVPQTLPPATRAPDSLPFRQDWSATSPGLSAPGPYGVTQVKAEPSEEPWDRVETATGQLVPGKAALPFHPAESAARGQAHDVEPPSSPEVRTAPVPLVRRGPVLPFGVPVPPPEQGPGAGPGVVDENEEPEVRTAPAPLISGQPALPFQPPASEHEPRFGPAPEHGSPDGGVTSTHPPPGALSMPGGIGVPIMDRPYTVLSLVQYASLCAELAVFPDEGEAIFRRYGLESQEKRSAVDAGWKRQLHENQLQYAAWQEAYRHYHSYWIKKAAARRSRPDPG